MIGDNFIFTAQDSFPTTSVKLSSSSKVRVGSEVLIVKETGTWYVKVSQYLLCGHGSGQEAELNYLLALGRLPLP